jgi:hypothetical protein
MRINSRKAGKILRRIWSTTEHIFETISTQAAPRCISMNVALTTFYFFIKSNENFPYTIFPVKKMNVWKNLKLQENCYFIILSIHILKLEVSGCDKSTPLNGISSRDSKKEETMGREINKNIAIIKTTITQVEQLSKATQHKGKPRLTRNDWY